MRVYISGKITGLDIEEARLNFNSAERRLREAGIDDIFNPMKEIPYDLPYSKQMELCLQELDKCQCIVMLHNWSDSAGAKKELTVAMGKGINYFFDRPDQYEIIKKNLCQDPVQEPAIN